MKLAVAQCVTLAHAIKGGQEVQADQLYGRIAGCGHRIEIITTAHPTGLRETEVGRVRTHHIPHLQPGVYSQAWWRASYEKLKELVYRGEADILLSQGAGALPYLPAVRPALDLPTLLMVHATAGADLARAWHARRSPRGLWRLLTVLAQAPQQARLWRRAATAADAVCVTSREVAQAVQREWRVPDERLHVLPAGIDMAHFATDTAARHARRADLQLDETAPVALYAGRLVHEKGVQVALAALAQVPGVTLVVAGAGEYEGALRRQAAGLKNRVRFLGQLTRAQLAEQMQAADMFLLPVLHQAGLPVVLLEALAAGLPVLAPALGGIPSVLTHEQNGLHIAPHSADSLAEALQRLVGDPALRARLGAQAAETARTRFSIEQMTVALLTVIERIPRRPTRGQG